MNCQPQYYVVQSFMLPYSFIQVENYCPLRLGRTKENDCAIPADKEYPDCGNKIAVCTVSEFATLTYV